MKTNYTLRSLEQAFLRLKEALAEPKTGLTRDASIKRFEFSFELAWKSIQKYLYGEGISCASPKSCFREAYKAGWVTDSPLWIRMIEDRNLTVHTYNESVAEDIYSRLSSYLPLVEGLIENLKKAERSETE